jgi:hypothetical protein
LLLYFGRISDAYLVITIAACSRKAFGLYNGCQFTSFYLIFEVPPEEARKLNLPPEFVNKTPSGEIFVKPELQKVIASCLDNSCSNFEDVFSNQAYEHNIRVYFLRSLKNY